MHKEVMEKIDRERQVVFLRALVDRIVSREGLTGRDGLGRSLLVSVRELDELADRIARGEDWIVKP